MVKESFLAQFYGKSQNYMGIPNKWYKEYGIKKGLRNENGTGMRVGLTRVANIMGYEETDGRIKAIPGRLLYRGVDVPGLVKGKKGSHFGCEETCSPLLFGYLPKKAELEEFCSAVRHCYTIPNEFVEMNLLHLPSRSLMNKPRDAIPTLYSYDDDPDNIDVYQTLVRGVNLLAEPPSVACYACQGKVHCYDRESLFIHYANPECLIAENFLSLLRKNRKFTSKEANLLDTTLILHTDHGGGNNSTFTSIVTAFTGTDIYSTVRSDIDSLRGPRHGDTSIKAAEMMDAVLAETGGYGADDRKIRRAVERPMAGESCDRSGLVCDFGHAVYTVFDPCAEVLRACCMEVAKEQKHTGELDFYMRFERIAKEVMGEIKDKTFPTDVDFYNGFTYGMLRIPRDLYTLLFVCSRVVDWMAHNIESKLYDSRIMCPATKYVGDNMDYVPMPERQDARYYHSGFLIYVNM